MRRRPHRPLVPILSTLLTAALALGVGAWLAAPLVRDTAARLAGATTITELSPNRAVLQGLAIGPLRIGEAVVTYGPLDLLREGRVRSASLRDVALTASTGAAVLTPTPLFETLAELIATPRFEEIVVADAQIPTETGPIVLAGTARLDGPTLSIAADLTAGGPGTTLPRAVRLRVDAKATRAGETLALALTAATPDRRMTARLDGRHDMAQRRGQATLTLEPLRFEEAFQPKDALPRGVDALENVRGTVRVSSRARWTATSLTAPVTITAEGLAFSAQGVAVTGLNGRLTLPEPWALKTEPGQSITIERIDAGLPLTDMSFTFHLAAEPARLIVEEGRWALAGGTIASGDVALPFAPKDRREQRVVLSVENVDLAELLGLVPLEGLSGSGRLSGTVPVVLRPDGSFGIEAGVLVADTGALRYAPNEPPAALHGQGEGLAVALAALRNFRYDTLKTTLDAPPNGPIRLTSYLYGRNPDLYGGHPIEFNLNIEAPAGETWREALRAFTLFDMIRDRLPANLR